MKDDKKLFLRPVSRRLMAFAMAYLAGIYAAGVASIPLLFAGFLCAFFLIAGLLCLRAGKKALLAFCALALVAGNGAAGMQLSLRDAPTAPNTTFGGTVIEILSDYRVRLDDVHLPSGETNRPVVVTLMVEDNAPQKPDMPRIGQRVEGTGRLFAPDEIRNPGGTDDRIRAICDGYELSGYLLPGWMAQGSERFSFGEWFRRLRESLVDHVQVLFGENASLFLAVMLGERSEIDAELAAAMRLTGTAHVLSVSGMHLSLIAMALETLLRYLPIGKRASRAIRIAALLFFTGLTGCAVGTLRALVMTLIRMYARSRGRRYDQLTALSLAALVITLAAPLTAFEAGFQFSFFVVLGIILLRRPIAQLRTFRFLRRKARWLFEMLVVSLCAQIAAAPMQLVLYGYVPLLSLPMNLLCSMLMAFIMIGGWGAALIGAVFKEAGVLLCGALSLVAQGFEAASLSVGGLEGGILRLPSPGRLSLVVIGAIMALISGMIRFGGLRRRTLAAMVALLSVLLAVRFDPSARYVQIDVGQGDASLIRQGRHAVIVDVGPADSYDLLRYLRHEGLFVDAVILSHLDEDHAGALGVLLSSEISIDRVIIADGATQDISSIAVHEGLSALQEAGIEPETVAAGDVIEAGGISLDVLSPDEGLSGSNERSLLLMADVEGATILTTGDLPINCEPEQIPDCDVLKVAHHGSKNASSAEFLKEASPKIAIISAGAGNSYGHPHDRVLGDLKAVGARVERTDLSGCVTVWLGETLRVTTAL